MLFLWTSFQYECDIDFAIATYVGMCIYGQHHSAIVETSCVLLCREVLKSASSSNENQWEKQVLILKYGNMRRSAVKFPSIKLRATHFT